MILAFGDSLTYGFGAESEFSYPKLMPKKTGLKFGIGNIDRIL